MAALRGEEQLLPDVAGRDVRAFMDGLKAADRMDAQAAYVALFDQSRSLSLHIFEHIHGESRDRGQEMVDLLAHYRSKGLDLTTDERSEERRVGIECVSTVSSQ